MYKLKNAGPIEDCQKCNPELAELIRDHLTVEQRLCKKHLARFIARTKMISSAENAGGEAKMAREILTADRDEN